VDPTALCLYGTAFFPSGGFCNLKDGIEAWMVKKKSNGTTLRCPVLDKIR